MRNLGELDLNLLVVFRHLMQERSVAGAAKKLCVTPSAVSKALGKLRDWFGDPLFVRVRQGLQPTNLSLTLAEELKTWFQLTESISTLNREAIPEGARFSLVMESPFGISFLSELPTTIYQKYPHSVVRMLGWDHHSLNDIVNGEADLGFCARETHGRSHARVNRLPYYIDHEVLFCDRPVVFLRKDHPLLGQTWSLTRFLACPQVSVVWEASDSWALDDLLEDEGHRRQVPIMVASFEQALHIAAQKSHELIAVVPSYLRGLCRQTSPRPHPHAVAAGRVSLCPAGDRLHPAVAQAPQSGCQGDVVAGGDPAALWPGRGGDDAFCLGRAHGERGGEREARGRRLPGLVVLLFHPGFDDELGGDAVHAPLVQRLVAATFKQAGAGIRGGEPLVLELHRLAEATVQAIAELASSHRDLLVRAIHVERQTDDQQIRLPLLDQLLYLVPVGDAVVGLEGAKGAGAARELLADGDTDALGAVVKAHDAA